MQYSVGIGLTNNCNLNCPHCYRDPNKISNITLDQIKTLCEAIPISSIGMGTGENILNPEFYKILEFLAEQDIKLSIASNGLTITSLNVKYLKLFNDVEVSIDFPNKSEQDRFRGQGNWDLVHQAIERIKKIGLELTILTTLMSINYNKMDRMVELAHTHHANLRVNVYQPINSHAFHLSYGQFWEGYRSLFKKGDLISCSEPVVRSVLGLGDIQSPCGSKSIRINPKGQVIPCVYWCALDDSEPIPEISDLAELGLQILDLKSFKLARQIPPVASNCPCQGGCASRRALNGDLNAHDEYCPWCREEQIDLEWRKAPSQDLVRISNNCTTIVV